MYILGEYWNEKKLIANPDYQDSVGLKRKQINQN